MKRLLLIFIAVLAASAFGQAPLTYPNARTDWCELGNESNCASQQQVPYIGCQYWANGTYTPGAAAWSSSTTYALGNTASDGSGNVYRSLQNGNTKLLSNTSWWANMGKCGTAPNVGGLTGANAIITEPYFGSQVVRVTDGNTGNGPCGFVTYNNFSGGNFNNWAADSSALIIKPSNGVGCVFAFNPATMQTVATPIVGSGSADPTCATNCTQSPSGAQFKYSTTNPTLIWEVIPSLGSVYRDVVTACTVPPGTGYCVPGGSSSGNVAPTFANAANWVFSRTLVLNILSPPGCSGCTPLPSDFVPNYTGSLVTPDDDSVVTYQLSDNGQSVPQFGTGPAITSIGGNGTIVSVTNSAMTGWSPAVGSPMQINGVTTTTAYNTGTTAIWTVCGTGSGCTNPTATSFQFLSSVTGTGGVSGATASYPNKTCPAPSGADPMNFSGGNYGPIYVVVAKPGAGPGGVTGWRLYDTCNGVITGNYGDNSASIWPNTAAPTSGTGYIVGQSSGSSIPDRCYQHESDQKPNPLYAGPSCETGQPAWNPGSCSGTVCGGNFIFWESLTTNVRICTITGCTAGHAVNGYINNYVGHNLLAFSYENPNAGSTPGLAFPLTSIDNHSSYNNDGYYDYQPMTIVPQLVCDQNGTPGSPPTGTVGALNGPCSPYYQQTWQNELLLVENATGNAANAANAYGEHCNYNSAASACVYRPGPPYNTGTSWDFNAQNSIANISPDGHWLSFASDWNLTLGCTNGWTGTGGQLCLDPVSAGNTTSGTISATAWDGAGGATITTTNPTTFMVGMYVLISGTTESCLNHAIFITSVTGTTFTGTQVGGSCTPASSNSSDTGTAKWQGCASTSLSNAACPRNDVFVMNLLSAHAGPPPTFPNFSLFSQTAGEPQVKNERQSDRTTK